MNTITSTIEGLEMLINISMIVRADGGGGLSVEVIVLVGRS